MLGILGRAMKGKNDRDLAGKDYYYGGRTKGDAF